MLELARTRPSGGVWVVCVGSHMFDAKKFDGNCVLCNYGDLQVSIGFDIGRCGSLF